MKFRIQYLGHEDEKKDLVKMEEICSSKVISDDDFQIQRLEKTKYFWGDDDFADYKGLIAKCILNDKWIAGFMCYKKDSQGKQIVINKINAAPANYNECMKFMLNYREQLEKGKFNKIVVICNEYDDNLIKFLKENKYIAKSIQRDTYVFERNIV